ncbi:hypothetical protein OF83DRAFT_1158615 [Amylostereum chailletii]|nr:hypothetical protein OF83DRAFT_1158615 [Amylostereum chailletii]
MGIVSAVVVVVAAVVVLIIPHVARATPLAYIHIHIHTVSLPVYTSTGLGPGPPHPLHLTLLQPPRGPGGEGQPAGVVSRSKKCRKEGGAPRAS